MWATVLELDVVPVQERHPSFGSRVSGAEVQAIKCKTDQVPDQRAKLSRLVTVDDRLLVIPIHILTGSGASQVVQDQRYPCPKELPPWFLERRNISRRHPGQGLSGKLVALVFVVSMFESKQKILYSNISLIFLAIA